MYPTAWVRHRSQRIWLLRRRSPSEVVEIDAMIEQDPRSPTRSDSSTIRLRVAYTT